MFQMIDEEKPTAEDRRMLWVKVAIFTGVIAVAGAVLYFFWFVPYGR
jgi:flagellar basal body-associated protein FliL